MRGRNAWVTGLVLLAAWLPSEPVLARGVPADRNAWRWEASSFHPIKRGGWIIPGPYRRDVLARWDHVPSKGELDKAARTGDIYDLIFMARAYHHGHRHWTKLPWRHVKKDRYKAERIYRLALRSGKNTLALVGLADLLHPGSESVRLYEQAARLGDPEAQLKLADLRRAEGDPPSEWRSLYQRAAAGPYPLLEARLREINLLIDEGRDRAAVDRYASRAKGIHVGLRNAFYEDDQRHGLASYTDYRVTEATLRLAEGGDSDAMWRYAAAIKTCKYTPRDPMLTWHDRFVPESQREQLLARVQAFNDQEVDFTCGDPEVFRADVRRVSKPWLERSAAAGNTTGMTRLSQLLWNESGRHGSKETFRWLRRAADLGDVDAKTSLRNARFMLGRDLAEAEKAEAHAKKLRGIVGVLGEAQ